MLNYEEINFVCPILQQNNNSLSIKNNWLKLIFAKN